LAKLILPCYPPGTISAYDAEKTLERFAAAARDETDLDALTAELLRVIQETMQPEHVCVWLRDVDIDGLEQYRHNRDMVYNVAYITKG